jgi:hypothetical protein
MKEQDKDGLRARVRKAMLNRTAWNNLDDLVKNIDFINSRMPEARDAERATEINKYLTKVV